MPQSVPRYSWQILRHREFRLYFTGSLVSNIGTWLQNTVQVLLAYQLTHSVFAVGVVASAQFAGMLLSPWAAVLADRIGSVRTLIGAQWVSAFVAFGMALCYTLRVLGEDLLVIGALSLGLAYSLALPVQTALVPTLVKPSDTRAALTMNSVSYNSGRALAPILCVLMIVFIGPGLVFTLNAVSFVVFAIILAYINDKSSLANIDAERHASLRRARVTDGIKIAFQQRRILLLLAFVAAVTLADDPIFVLSPSLAHASLRVSSNWGGYFIAALGWGTVVGSWLPSQGHSPRDPSQASRRAALSLLLLGVSIVVFAAGLSTLISLAAAFLAGAAALLTGATVQTLMIARRRRTVASVTALWAIAWAGTKPIASLIDGWLASRVGILLTALALAGPAMLLALAEIGLPRKVKESIKRRSAEYVSRRSEV